MKKRKIIVIPIIAILVLVIFVVTLRAQTPQPGLTVHPTNLDLNLDAGTPQKGTIYLRNNTKLPVSIKTSLRNFTAQGEEGGVALTTEDIPFSLAKWVKITPEKVNIAPQQEVAFEYTITPPANAEPGGHFGSVVFATVPSTNVSGAAGSAVSAEIATLFLARIPGPVVEQASIVSFNTEQSFYEFGPAKFDLRVRDEGGVHIRPAGVITLTNTFGQKDVLGFEGQNILPGAVRKMLVIWPKHWLIGKYTANLALTYGSKNTQLYATTEFFAFPWKIGVAVLFVILILILGRRRIGKALKAIAKG